MPIRNERVTKTAPPYNRALRRDTLIKFVAVLAILALLAAWSLTKLRSKPDEAMRVVAKHDIGTIMLALDMYRRDNGRYPTQAQGLRALIEKPVSDPKPTNWKDDGYLKRLPDDPWGSLYQYLNPGVRGTIDVFSYGPDARQGGEGNDADIGSWD
ncbi:general secretion pathway protein G [Caballeronia arvi]|uniref:General secretion pathway protein G n=1 Tax=Caballeronia arvi TaxID=1777135 RepID=A0A158L568_9BURK|nr:type II secretion system major pseudopilin GspG [Caballeronia arvi]SAL88537.1 general secretion pathway protein G [Caballeronia arvi]